MKHWPTIRSMFRRTVQGSSSVSHAPKTDIRVSRCSCCCDGLFGPTRGLPDLTFAMDLSCICPEMANGGLFGGLMTLLCDVNDLPPPPLTHYKCCLGYCCCQYAWVNPTPPTGIEPIYLQEVRFGCTIAGGQTYGPPCKNARMPLCQFTGNANLIEIAPGITPCTGACLPGVFPANLAFYLDCTAPHNADYLTGCDSTQSPPPPFFAHLTTPYCPGYPGAGSNCYLQVAA